MTTQELIQSGLIEAYVLGQASAEERAQVERMAAQHPEVRTELAAVEQALEQYASADAVTPPAWMKGRILDLVKQEPGLKSATPTTTSSPPASNLSRLITAGLLVATAVLGFFYWQNRNERQNLQNQVTTLQAQAEDCAKRDARLQAIEKQVAFLRDRDTKAIAMSDGKNTAYVYYNPVRHEAYLDVSGMPGLPPGKYYQAWAVPAPGKGQVASAGMVNMQAIAGWSQLRYLPDIVGFAISLEDKPTEAEKGTVVIMHS